MQILYKKQAMQQSIWKGELPLSTTLLIKTSSQCLDFQTVSQLWQKFALEKEGKIFTKKT